MTGRTPVTEETFIRQLPFSVINYLARLLDVDKQWERFVCRVPKKLQNIGSSNFEGRYSQLQVRIFEDKGKKPDGSATRSIIDDWGTQNTKVKHLLYVLKECALYEAADYLAVNVLHGKPVSRADPACEEDKEPNLPAPNFDDFKKKGIDSSVSVLPDTNQSNLDRGEEKKVYGMDKMHETFVQHDFNLVREGVQYNRITSFDSGGTPSVDVMQTPPPGRQQVQNDETVQVRPVKEPCETTDESPTMDQFSLIGSQRMPYELLVKITDSFNDVSFTKGGRVIGCGGFGQVYLGIFPNGMKVAVKSLKNVTEVEKQFETELESLSKFRDENIVSLLGYSVDGPSKCLVYEYLSNGSLEDRLMCRNDTPPLPVALRVSIAQGTAKGIFFLNKNGVIHRDIKSANILLDESFQPKVGDFATARAGPKGVGKTIVNTTLVIGTPAYLAPEAMNFDISTKLDSFSFGVVLLELLTGLPAMDHDREDKDLKSHVDEADDLTTLLDKKAGEWPKVVVMTLESVADKCLQHKKKHRANVEDIISELNSV